MEEPGKYALVPQPARALEGANQRAKQLLAGMVKEALSLARQSGKDAEAIFQRGLDFYAGRGVLKNLAQATSCFKEAAELTSEVIRQRVF